VNRAVLTDCRPQIHIILNLGGKTIDIFSPMQSLRNIAVFWWAEHENSTSGMALAVR
jgi:hypothetical protein